ncbi:MAG: hypothetical protein U1D99_00155, partial [Candidatus Omnitrophota bacterium]|nr:hypothetical protein [Candidatus Omnitrophota bacterium]
MKMENGRWKMDRRKENGEWKIEDGRWRMEKRRGNGGWKIEDGDEGCRAEPGPWGSEALSMLPFRFSIFIFLLQSGIFFSRPVGVVTFRNPLPSPTPGDGIRQPRGLVVRPEMAPANPGGVCA